MHLLPVLLLVLGSAFALEPGQTVTVTLPDGSLVSGVVVSSSTQPPPPALPPLGFNTPPPGQLPPIQTGTFIGVPIIPVQPLTREQKQEFLKQQAEEREARKHQVTSSLSDWQFDLQQAIDRQAHGLPFTAPR